jgi:hypothetical protein
MMGLDWKSAGLDLQAAVEYLKKVRDQDQIRPLILQKETYIKMYLEIHILFVRPDLRKLESLVFVWVAL